MYLLFIVGSFLSGCAACWLAERYRRAKKAMELEERGKELLESREDSKALKV